MFVLAEQIIKFSVDKTDGNFHEVIIEAQKKNLIYFAEFQILNSLKDIRNKIFHESHFPTGLEIEGIFWSFGEDETKELIYKEYSQRIFNLVFKLLTK